MPLENVLSCLACYSQTIWGSGRRPVPGNFVGARNESCSACGRQEMSGVVGGICRYGCTTATSQQGGTVISGSDRKKGKAVIK